MAQFPSAITVVNDKGKEETKQVDWVVNITGSTIKAIKSKTDIEFLKLSDNDFEALKNLQKDDIKLIDLLWAIVEPQAERLNITQTQFEASIGGPSLRAGWLAFLESYRDFTRDQETLSNILTMIQTEKARENLLVEMEQRLDKIQKVTEAEVKKSYDHLTDKKITEMVRDAMDTSLESLGKKLKGSSLD